jgi:hypothetical protein
MLYLEKIVPQRGDKIHTVDFCYIYCMKQSTLIMIFGLLLGLCLIMSSSTNTGLDDKTLVSYSTDISLDVTGVTPDILADVYKQPSFAGTPFDLVTIRSFGDYLTPSFGYLPKKDLFYQKVDGTEVISQAT